jgi:ABC-type antimicrobial peptide transport system permease subunit
MSRVLDLAIGPARDLMSLLSLLTALALTLGAVGIYGVISQFVGRRKREWSIRVALGLAPARVVSLVVRHALALVGLGVIAGVAIALALTRFLSAFLYGITPRDPLTVGAASILLVLVGIVAALVPALRASRSDPALALREE